MISLKRHAIPALLTMILVLALIARLGGINFPRYHWDENFDTNSIFYASFNHLQLPTYIHGSFAQYLILGEWGLYLALNGLAPTTQNLVARFLADENSFMLLARTLMALAGTANVFVVYLMGQRIYGNAVGLVAAFWLATSFLHVSESHYARGHVLATLLVTLAVYFSLQVLNNGRSRDSVLAGVCVGLATAAQYTSVLAVIPLLVAHWSRARGHVGGRILDRSLLLGLDAAGVAFFAVTPFALIEFPFFAGELKWFITDVLNQLWVSSEGQPVLLFYLTEHLQYGMGLAMEILALVGMIYAVYRHTWRDVVLLAFPLVLFVTLARGANFARYALPLLPFLSIFGARFLCDVVKRISSISLFFRFDFAVATIAILAAIPSALDVARFDYWLTQPDTRAIASAWIKDNVPNGASIMIEGADVLGPPVPVSSAQLDAQVAGMAQNKVERVLAEATRDRANNDPGYWVEPVFRIDQVHEGGIAVRSLDTAAELVQKGIDYIVKVDWMQSEAMEGYSSPFQSSLDASYEKIGEFRPSIEFQFDPFAWRVDYQALSRVIPGQPGVAGPHLTVLRRKMLDPDLDDLNSSTEAQN